MGLYLDKPETEKYNECGSGNGLHYGVSSMQGWREEMEDNHTAVIGLPGEEFLKDWSFFGIFDGHFGGQVSEYSSKHLLETILQTEEFKGSEYEKGIRNGFLLFDSNIRELSDLCSSKNNSGSTAVCSFISPNQIFIANCGDSRLILCRNGVPEFASEDHKPYVPAERDRIEKAGGSVMCQRVNGSLAVSRALGDFEYKSVEGKEPCEQLVSPEPDVFVLDRYSVGDEFLVMACDGIWDVMGNRAVCNFVRSRLLISDDLKYICNQVINTCLHKGSRDNMTIIIVTFPGAPKVSEEAVQKERELEVLLEAKVKELVEVHHMECFRDVINTIRDEYVPGLPPGGGLESKYEFIEKIYREVSTNGLEDEEFYFF